MQIGKWAFCAALIALAVLTPQARAQGENPIALLRSAIDAPKRVSFVGEVQNLQIGESKSIASIYRIEHRAPNQTRRWYLAPQSLYGDSIVSLGESTYSVDVKRGRVVVSKENVIDDQVALDDNFGLLVANYRPVFGPDDNVAGRRARVVLVINKYTGALTMRIWIDTQTKLVIQKERYAANGSLTSQVRFAQIRYTNDIPAALFALPSLPRVAGTSHAAPSNDLVRAVKQAGFDARGPRYLPDGFVPIAADVTDVQSVRTLHLLYSDGIRTISLFENARGAGVDMSRYRVSATRVENNDAQYVQEGPTTLLSWSESGLHFTLVGELGHTELERIAASVVP